MRIHARTHFTRTVLRLAIAVVVTVYFVAGLHPFDFFPKNQVAWSQRENGLEFLGFGEAYGLSSFDFDDAPASVPAVSLDFVVSSYEGRRPSIETLLTFHQRSQEESFAIERWTEDLVVAGWFRDRQGQTSFRRLFCGQVFAKSAPQLITVTSSDAGTFVYVEGIQQRQYPDLLLASRNLRGTVLLGQSASGHQEWRGVIAGLALYDKAFSPDQVVAGYSLWQAENALRLRERAPRTLLYTFEEGQGTLIHNLGNFGSHLTIPGRLRALSPAVLKVPTRRDLADWSDISLNLLGFIPFGALVVIRAWVSKPNVGNRDVLLAVVFGFAISLAIELLQVLLPSRDSSLLDLIMNTGGTWIGGAVGLFACSRLDKRGF